MRACVDMCVYDEYVSETVSELVLMVYEYSAAIFILALRRSAIYLAYLVAFKHDG